MFTVPQTYETTNTESSDTLLLPSYQIARIVLRNLQYTTILIITFLPAQRGSQRGHTDDPFLIEWVKREHPRTQYIIFATSPP